MRRPALARFTHVALPCTDIDATIAWYERFTPLRLLEKRQDDLGFGAWLGQPESAERPFILVLAQFLPDTDPFKAFPGKCTALQGLVERASIAPARCARG